MTMQISNCPECQSDDITYNPKRNKYRCEECEHIWFEEIKSDNTVSDNELVFCHKLAGSNKWSQTVINTWPAPIAHEYDRLRKILKDGAFIPAMLQLKDVAEILIKFHTISMYQWIKTYKPEVDANATQPSLFSILSMGAWHNLSGQLAKIIIKNNHETDHPFGFQVASYFFKPKSTPINKLLSKLISWRNKEIGHGAFRLNTSELWEEFESLLEQLHDCITINDPWQHYQLVIDENHSNDIATLPPLSPLHSLTPLAGSSSIHLYHSDLTPIENKQHIVSAHPLYITVKQNIEHTAIPLSPLIQAQTCNVCQLQDVFIFDSHNQYNKKFFFLDYLTGHQLGIHSHQSPLLKEAYQHTNLVHISDEDSTLNKSALNEDVVELLKEKSLEANYISPKYLQDNLATFINNHEKGLFWLTAPAHVGKSIFVHGIANGLDKKPMLDDLIVVRFHIRREFRYFSHHMTEALGNQLKEAFNLTSGNEILPEIDTSLGHSALTSWLNEWWHISPYKHTHQLLIAIDGLDEIGQKQSSSNSTFSILDLLPTTDTLSELNDNIYLLVTSRPVLECPTWMQSQLTEQFTTSINDSLITKLEVDLEYPAYLNILKQYLINNLQTKLNSLKEDKQSYIEELFSTILEKSEKRFLYFSLLIDIIKEHNLDLYQLRQLPEGEGLYTYFISSLESKLGGKESKHFIKVKQLLTLLTACEQASVMDAQIMQESASNPDESNSITAGDAAWSGLDLATIAALLNESAGEHSTQLIFTLYSLKSLINVERSTEHAQYRLGLKELSGYINTHWGDEVLEWHRQITEPFYYTWQNRWDELDLSIPENIYQLRYFVSHSSILKNNLIYSIDIALNGFLKILDKQGRKFRKNANFLNSIQYKSLNIYCLRKLINNYTGSLETSENLIKSLVLELTSRAGIYRDVINYSAAIHDLDYAEFLFNEINNKNFLDFDNLMGYTFILNGKANCFLLQSEIQLAIDYYLQSISLFRAYINQFSIESYPNRNLYLRAFANTLCNCTLAYTKLRDMSNALDSIEMSIDLYKQLYTQLDLTDSPPSFLPNLALLLMNRGAIYGKNNTNPSLAIEDFNSALSIMQTNKVDPKILSEPENQIIIANTLKNRGSLFQDNNKFNLAINDYQSAIDIMNKLYNSHDVQLLPQWQYILSKTYSLRSDIYLNLKMYDSAISDLNSSLELLDELYKLNNKNFCIDWLEDWIRDILKMVTIYYQYDNIHLALEKLNYAIKIINFYLNSMDEDVISRILSLYANTLSERATCYEKIQQLERASEDHDQAVNIVRKLYDHTSYWNSRDLYYFYNICMNNAFYYIGLELINENLIETLYLAKDIMYETFVNRKNKNHLDQFIQIINLIIILDEDPLAYSKMNKIVSAINETFPASLLSDAELAKIEALKKDTLNLRSIR